jgi:hypothetical protein
MSSRTRFLHVANGTSTTSTIEDAGIPGICSIWADPLHEGPVPDRLSDAELLEVRRQYLAGGSLDPVNDLREWRAVIERHDSYDELVLWFEHDLFDQLNLIQLLTWIRGHLPTTAAVSLICIGSYPGRPDFKGLGELSARELAPLFETRRSVSDPQYELAARAWQAFRAPTPEPLAALCSDDPSLPFLGPALQRFLQEYPWTSDGLSRTERRLLQLAADGGIRLSHAFPRMHDGEHAYYVTDTTLAATAETLARTSVPLLDLDVSSPDQRHLLQGRVRLTDAGRSVLSGELDRVTTCGIDRWLGGVHLQSGTRVWRWDEARHQITS